MIPILICVIYDYNGSKIRGYRLIDAETKKTMDVTVESVMSNIAKGMNILGLDQKGRIINNRVPKEMGITKTMLNIEYDTVIELLPNNIVRVSNYRGDVYEVSYTPNCICYENTPKGEEYKVLEGVENLHRKTNIFKRIYDINEFGVAKCREDYPKEKYPEVLELPRGVLTIGLGGFAYCNGIKKVIIPDTVSKICASAFKYMRDLEEVEVLGAVKVIPRECFYGCVKLKKVTLSPYLEKIEEHAFQGCNSLQKINYLGSRKLEIKYEALPYGCVIIKNRKLF